MLEKILAINRPIVCLDFETTGTDPSYDRIVQIGIVKLYPDGRMTEWETPINPGVEMSAEVEKFFRDNDVYLSNAFVKHGCIHCRLLKEEHPHEAVQAGLSSPVSAPKCDEFKPVPSFASVAPVLYAGLNGCDLAGYNLGSFDVPLLKVEFKRVNISWEPGRILDAFKMAQRLNPRNLSWFVEKYVSEEQRQSFKAHDALHDARQTLLGLLGFFEAHPDFPRDVQRLHDMFFVEARDASSLDPEGKFAWRASSSAAGGYEAIVNFGKKHKGKTLREVKALDPGFFRDFILKGDFNATVQKIAREALEGRFPERK